MTSVIAEKGSQIDGKPEVRKSQSKVEGMADGFVSTWIEDDFLGIRTSGTVASEEEYRLLTDRFCEEVTRSGLRKVLLDESGVRYVPSFRLHLDIIEYYSRGDLPESMNSWKIARVWPDDSMIFFEAWQRIVNSRGFSAYKSFPSVERAREYMSECDLD